MPRQTRKAKPLIYVFCEGESEQAYTKFLKEKFANVAVIKFPRQTGLFKEAKQRFDNDPKYRDIVDSVDEIWFFFDVEEFNINRWEEWLKIMNSLRKKRKNPRIVIRLLMTTGCVEYWLLLHYEMTTPSISTVAEKEQIIKRLQNYVPTYTKGNLSATYKIASNFQKAIQNGAQTLDTLIKEGLPSREDSDARNAWLCQCRKTFTTVQEAIQFLENQ